MRPPRGTLEHLIRTRWRYWYLGLRKALALLQATWIAYSKPIPASCSQLLTQVLLCGALALAAASLTYCWLASSLLYPLGPSAVVATVCGLLAFLGLVLVPPARCLFALSVPTLGTEQGRRLLLSWSTATLTVAVVPNVLANLRAAGQVLRLSTPSWASSPSSSTSRLQRTLTSLPTTPSSGSCASLPPAARCCPPSARTRPRSWLQVPCSSWLAPRSSWRPMPAACGTASLPPSSGPRRPGGSATFMPASSEDMTGTEPSQHSRKTLPPAPDPQAGSKRPAQVDRPAGCLEGHGAVRLRGKSFGVAQT